MGRISGSANLTCSYLEIQVLRLKIPSRDQTGQFPAFWLSEQTSLAPDTKTSLWNFKGRNSPFKTIGICRTNLSLWGFINRELPAVFKLRLDLLQYTIAF